MHCDFCHDGGKFLALRNTLPKLKAIIHPSSVMTQADEMGAEWNEQMRVSGGGGGGGVCGAGKGGR